ncbi:MAG TPA: twin-arginine translocase subunit TatC [Thermomicrobiales bacterium]|nr:twin-arginine translocase subunit TatC [Thermomicrobiales bacterium]
MSKLAKLPAPRMPRVPKLRRPSRPDWMRPEDGSEEFFEEMTLGEHLLELRNRVVKACISVGVAFIIGIILAIPMLKRINEDAHTQGGLDIQSPTDPLTIYFKIALYIAIGLSFPLLMYQLLAFVAPGLTRKEKRIVYTALPFVGILAVAGGAYGFFVAAPRALYFLSNFLSNSFSWQPDAGNVVTFYMTLILGLALAFQIPVIMFILAKINLVSPKKMGEIRKYAFIVILILAAVITPSTDPINMSIVAVPLYVLYEFGIIIAKIFAKTPIAAQPISPGDPIST